MERGHYKRYFEDNDIPIPKKTQNRWDNVPEGGHQFVDNVCNSLNINYYMSMTCH